MMNKKQRFKLVICCTCLLLLEGPVSAEIRIPPTPAQDGYGDFVQDYESAIDTGRHRDRIGEAQRVAFEEYDTPIIVVVITRMAPYGHHQPNIEPFATQWFNQWEIGTENTNGKNQGVLLLISVGDRKGRIELGADWGYQFDNHCQSIMDNVMIPHFKAGDYSSGITEGVEALLKMVAVGPGGKADSLPRPKSNIPISFSFGSSGSGILFWPLRIILLPLGIWLLILGIKSESDSYKQQACSCGGIGLIILAIYPPFYFIALMTFIGILPRSVIDALGSGSGSSGSWGGGGGGGGFSGGGFSGGSSGGGGASGSW